MSRVLRITTRAAVVVALTGLSVCSTSGGGILVPGDDPGAGTAASVTVSPTAATIEVGHTLQMIATLLDDAGAEVSGDVSWASSNGDVASVSEGGLVSGVAMGAATITATAGTLSRGSTLTVIDPPTP